MKLTEMNYKEHNAFVIRADEAAKTYIEDHVYGIAEQELYDKYKRDLIDAFVWGAMWAKENEDATHVMTDIIPEINENELRSELIRCSEVTPAPDSWDDFL